MGNNTRQRISEVIENFFELLGMKLLSITHRSADRYQLEHIHHHVDESTGKVRYLYGHVLIAEEHQNADEAPKSTGAIELAKVLVELKAADDMLFAFAVKMLDAYTPGAELEMVLSCDDLHLREELFNLFSTHPSTRPKSILQWPVTKKYDPESTTVRIKNYPDFKIPINRL